jgi:membrane associated rhomboid family serine protease
MPQYRTAWPPLTENIKITLAILVGFFLAGFEFTEFVHENMLVSSREVLVEYQVWTVLTYAFWHFDFGHLLFNGVALWMFGGELDQRWGTQKFWTVSLLAALGGGVAVVLTQLVFGGSAPTLGYSGAVMGLVGAFCWYAWDRTLYFFFFPMSGKSLLGFFLVIDFARVFIGGAPVSIAAHMGGLIVGLLAATGWWRPKKAKRAYKQWKRRRNFKSHTGGGSRWN